MKAHSTPHTRPFHLIQVIRRELRWAKEEKDEVKLKEWLAGPKELELSAYVENSRLFLANSLAQDFKPDGIQWVVIFQEESSETTKIHGLKGNQSLSLPPLNFNLEEEKLQIHFQWDYFQVGDPSRDPMKIASLPVGKTLEFKINGKKDFSLTGRRPRHYLEQNFLILNHGVVESWGVMETPFSSKNIRAEKIVDLRKLLW